MVQSYFLKNRTFAAVLPTLSVKTPSSYPTLTQPHRPERYTFWLLLDHRRPKHLCQVAVTGTCHIS
jgi:hypothetical protein